MISISSLLLKSSLLRKSILTNLKSKYFHELGLSIPVKNDYWAHLSENDSYNSFSEIFIKQEYEDILPEIQYNKILDLGAHYGYFSLWLQAKTGAKNFRSLLVEPSSLCRCSLENLVSQPKLSGRFKYLIGALGNPKNKNLQFFERPFMASSNFDFSQKAPSKKINIVTQDEITESLEPPYDLIKCDIEGAEWEFIQHYQEILFQSRYLIMEWHSWHNGGGGFEKIIQGVENLGFELVKSFQPREAKTAVGEVGLFLAQNKSFEN